MAFLIAHRGASYDAPENTLASVRLAWEQKADAVEVDVHAARDGRIVVIHDPTTRKTTGVPGRVGHLTWEELQALEVGRWKHTRWAGERIPSLGQVLAAVPRGKRIFVEIKGGVDCLAEFEKEFRSSRLEPGQVAVIGFSRDLVAAFKARLAAVEGYWVVEFKRTWRGGWSPSIDHLIRQTKAAGLDGVDLSARGPWSTAMVRQLHDGGLKVYVWTVDAPGTAQRLISAGVDGITTNRPGWMRARLEEILT
jgi:glycerophosphoryl diester phosphodiesterase